MLIYRQQLLFAPISTPAIGSSQGLKLVQTEPEDEVVALLPVLHLKFLLLPKGFVEVSSIGLLTETLLVLMKMAISLWHFSYVAIN